MNTLKNESINDIESRDEIVSAFEEYVIKERIPERRILPNGNMSVPYFQNLVNDVITRELKRLVHILMNNMFRLISVNKLKQRLIKEGYKLSNELISDEIDKLRDCYLLFTVPIRSYNTAVQAVNPKKEYCIDHAMAQAFCNSTSENKGLVLENMVYMKFRRTMNHIFCYKTEKGDEIDFAIGPDSKIQLIQVC